MYWDWFYRFGYSELLWISLGVVAYGLYLFRVIHIAIQLQNHKRWVFLKIPLRILYFTLLMISLLGPTFGTSKRYVQAVGKDIYILLDLSRSMYAQDVPPSRFEKARFELKNLLQGLAADRVGIIGFAEEAYLECPLTYDYGALTLFLQGLSPGLIGAGSTDFEPALQMALTRFDDSEEKTQNFKSKLVLLVSDGEDFGENYLSTLSTFRTRGIPVFVLGIGTEEGAKVPYKNSFIYDSKGKAVVSRLNPSALEKIANDTKGGYFCISKTQNESPQLIQSIKEVQGKKIDERAINVANNKYVYFLWSALGLMLLDFMFKIKVLRL
jgi:Ca-activated chloride channel family protein